MIGADNGGIDWRDRKRTRSHMPGEMILMAGRGIGLICRGDTGAGVCIPSRAPLGVNDLGSEPPGF